jgi:hypothetical protein
MADYLRNVRLTILGMGVLWSASALAGPSDGGKKAASTIVGRIAAKDCSGAVAELKAGLQQDFPEVALLAGAMYENGSCVQRDWNRAAPFYIQAWQGGAERAADRLAAGYAAPENGPDAAAALWWAHRSRSGALRPEGMPSCAVSDAAAADIDRFVAELQTWQPSRIAACTYMTGVMSTMSAEINYPELALKNDISGEVTLVFTPGVPRIEARQGTLDPGFVDQDTKLIRPKTRMAGFEKALGDVGDRAIRRYPRPAGIPADAQVRIRYRFQTN